MNDAVVRIFSIDIERNRRAIETLTRRNMGLSIITGVLTLVVGALFVELYLHEKDTEEKIENIKR